MYQTQKIPDIKKLIIQLKTNQPQLCKHIVCSEIEKQAARKILLRLKKRTTNAKTDFMRTIPVEIIKV